MGRKSSVLVVAVLSAALVSPAHAAQDDSAPEFGWVVRPALATDGSIRSEFNIEVAPGETFDDVLEVENLVDAPITLEIYGQEALMTPGGQYTAPAGRSEADSVGAWIESSTDVVDIGPNEVVEIPFTVSVPEYATPGDHAGAILTVLSSTTGDLGLESRVGARIHVRVPGDIDASLEISDIEVVSSTAWWNPLPRDVEVEFTVTNRGNVRVSALTMVDHVRTLPFVTDRRHAEGEVTPYLLPGSSIAFAADSVPGVSQSRPALTLQGVVPMGRQQYTVRLGDVTVAHTDERMPVVTAVVVVWEVPWIPLTALVLLVFWLTRKVLKARRRRARQLVGDTESPDDTGASGPSAPDDVASLEPVGPADEGAVDPDP